MNKLARLTTFDRRAAGEPFEGRSPRLRTRYYAFLSYSHKDKELADWLHRELERFRVPGSIAGKLTANGVVPRRLTPIFRDQHDLSAGDDLAVEIEAALAASQFLIVLCSPTAAKSRWTNLEIESFKRTRPEGCVLAAVVAGEPFASDLPGREDEECFPPALRFKYDRRGHRTNKRAEPLAADFREGGEGKRLALLKLVAGMLGVGLDELVQRETTRRHRQLAYVAAASLAGMAVTSTLAVTAIQARDEAREQRRQAENLVEFMLGDLKDKLEPIGKLDVLDGVGARVLDYYSKQDTKQLSDIGLAQRSRALTLMGQIARDRGELDRADALYRQAYAGTAEEVARNPKDPQRLYEHAQNAFWIGDLARQRGDIRGWEASAREYKVLAVQMTSLDPDNLKWRGEEANATANLGVALYDQRRFGEARNQFQQALSTIQGVTAVDPQNADYRESLIQALAWLADAQLAQGLLTDAIATRNRDATLLQQLLARTGDTAYRRDLITAERKLGSLHQMRGELDVALKFYRAAVADADDLIRVDRTNTTSVQYGYVARLQLAGALIAAGKNAEAASQVEAACGAIDGLLAKKSAAPVWRGGLRDCWLARSQVALATGAISDARRDAEMAMRVAETVKSTDLMSDQFLLAKAYRLIGDANSKAGDAAAARAAWSTALAAIPARIAEQPNELAEHALVLERLGRGAEAVPLNARLKQIGYKQSI